MAENNDDLLKNMKKNVWDKTKKRYVYASANDLKSSKRRLDKED
jgi:hypothetical protein